MGISEIYIVKRDGKRAPFSVEKIKRAISKAFLSVGGYATDDDLTSVLSRVRVSDGMSVEEIQNQVEVALMAERYFAVAKSYMLYRQKHSEDREDREKLEFLINYCDAKNPATGSKYDANANVENKNIATLIGELPKRNFIRLNRRLLTDRIKEMYGKELSDKYLRLLNGHFIYKNDETSMANYCASITMYPWLLGGTLSVGGNSTRPTNLKSFCGGFVNMVFIVSSMLSGACATPEFLMYMNYFIEQEYGEDYYTRADEVVDLSKKRRTIDKMITDCFEQIVYSINQPTGARNFQAVFWNVAYYDRYYFESLFGEFVFPDGSKPHWESLSWLQKRFMTWFNRERTKTVLTFPVETMALLTASAATEAGLQNLMARLSTEKNRWSLGKEALVVDSYGGASSYQFTVSTALTQNAEKPSFADVIVQNREPMTLLLVGMGCMLVLLLAAVLLLVRIHHRRKYDDK